MSDLSLTRKMICAGGAACVADLFTFPFDVAKVRLQIGQNSNLNGLNKNSGLISTLTNLARTEGLKSWWGGIVPGLQRQCVFASIRIGLYENIKNFYTDKLKVDSQKKSSVMMVRILSGITSGAIAISFAQPTDVVKVRMQAFQNLNSESKNSKISSGAMYKSIVLKEGVRGLWKGLLPNMARNSIVNATELVAYDTFKDFFITNNFLNDGLICHFSSGFSAGFMATLVASPIDVIKTRVMNGQSSFAECATDLAKKEGFFGFYKGFTPSFMRLGTWNICMFVTFEQFKKLNGNLGVSFAERFANLLAPLGLIDTEQKKLF